MIAPADQELQDAGRLEVEALDGVAAGVGLDRQQDADVVEDRRDERVDQHLQVADLEDLGDDERGGAERRRGQDRADAAGGHDPAALILRVAGLAQQRPGDAAERDRRGDAGARDRAEQEAGECARAPRAGAAAAEGGERDLDEEARGAGELQHGAVDREQHDVGRGDVERDAEDALQAHVGLADDAVQPVALVADLQHVGDQPAEEGVEQERDADRGQRPARRAARGLEHDDDRAGAEEDVGRRRLRGAAHELVAGDDGVADRRDGERGDDPVAHARLLRAAEQDEGQQQRDGQERGPVDLRGQRQEDPEDREQRQARAEDGDEARGEAGEVAARALGLELVEQVLGGLGGVAFGHGLCRRGLAHVPSTAIRRCTPCPYSGIRSPPTTSVRRPRSVAARAIVVKRAGWAGTSSLRVMRPSAS